VTANGTIGEYVLSVQQTASGFAASQADGEADDGSIVAMPWLNRAQPVDVSHDGYVTPRDALLIINSLSAEGARSLPAQRSSDATQPFYDVNGDGFLSPIDALQVINYLASRAEGESAVELLPSGDPAVAVQTTAEPDAVAQPLERLRRVPESTAILSKLPAAPAVGNGIASLAATAGKASRDAGIWNDPDQEWVIDDLAPAINALAEDVATLDRHARPSTTI
jgi:hypothetical protein